MELAGRLTYYAILLLCIFQVGRVYAMVRQAPFCTDHLEEPEELKNFQPIFESCEKNDYIPVSPNPYQSPSGFIKNITLSQITTTTNLLPVGHSWRVFNNFFHITIKASEESDGMEGLFVQPISAPLGVPFGEFVNDFDCGDCSNPPTKLENYSAILPCKYRPAAAYLHPQIFSVGGKNIPKKFYEAHFHFRYVDYPCFDVIYAQFLIIVVRKFNGPSQYEVFFSPLYKVNIEGVGAPSPMYYGWDKGEMSCHHSQFTAMQNWIPQRNSRVKVKYSEEFDKCTVGKTGEGKICPPGPVTCGSMDNEEKPPRTAGQWRKFRENYVKKSSRDKGVDVFCYDCGEYEEKIGVATWSQPEVNYEDEKEVSTNEEVVARVISVTPDVLLGKHCEKRDGFGKNATGGRDIFKKGKECEPDFATKLTSRGWQWGQRSLKIHSMLMLFSFTVGTNCLAYCARFLKETNKIEEGSGCWGIGVWLWGHIFWTYASLITMWGGFAMCVFQNRIVSCEIYDSKDETEFCLQYGLAHKVFGGLCLLIFHMGFGTGFTRPKTLHVRNVVVSYHALCGYLSKYIGLISLALIPSTLDGLSIFLIVLLEVCFLCFVAVGTMVQREMDSTENITDRKIFPVPEAIDTEPGKPLERVRDNLFSALLLTQLGLFTGFCLNQ